MTPLDPDSIPTSPLPPTRPAGLVPAATGQSWSVTPTPQAAFVAPTPEELAAHFPSLEIIEQLGQGGMGAVYKARQKSLDRMVAVKILPPKWAEDPNFSERFTREAKALARLNHPNVVTVYDSGQTSPPGGAPGLYYFLMEYVDGPSLRALMKAGKLDGSQVVDLASQLCDGLHYAHDMGLVHRDIKPENVLLDQRLRIKIADFGLSKILDDAKGGMTTLTRDGARLGTPQYMAPEQYDAAAMADKRVDIFATGVMLYEMLTGELPMGRFDPPSAHGAGNLKLDAIVLKALEQKPERRYQSAAELGSALSSTRAPAAPPAGYVKRQPRWLVITLRVLALVATCVLAYKFATRPSSKGEGEPPPAVEPPKLSTAGDKPATPPQPPPGPRRGPGGGGPGGPGGADRDGLNLPDLGARLLGVTGPNRAQVDKVLGEALREAVRLERSHSHVSVEAGKVSVRIESHEAEAKSLIDKTKSDVAALLDEEQRKRLDNAPKAMATMFDGEPGQERTVTMWKDGEQYHFDELRDGKSVRSASGPNAQVIPSRYRGYWAIHGSDYPDLAEVIAEAGTRPTAPRKRGERIERPKLQAWILKTPQAQERLHRFLDDAGIVVSPQATPAQLDAALERLARSMQGVIDTPEEP